ncbi:MAG: LCP family protein [Streptococcaceae bacterium]|jgi:anionic cell wall polymer biosynthesis LytR-Cps2A-Psr (LCP) family protein|nr:LCP family protein [Streptococcaceae bacterium]
MSRLDRYKKYREEIKSGKISGKELFSFFHKSFKNKKSKKFHSSSTEEDEYINRYIYGTDKKKTPLRFFKKSKTHRKGKYHPVRNVILALLLIFLIFAGSLLWRLNGALGTKPNVPVELFEGKTSANGAHNILILGTDQRENQSAKAARADSIMVLQMDGSEKRIKLVSFMRDILVDIPNVGVSGEKDCKLNAAYGIGEAGSIGRNNQNQGAELMRETLKQNFGIECRYYAIVNFSSFATAIDALFPHGIPIDAEFATIRGQQFTEVAVPDDLATPEKMVVSDVPMSAAQASLYGYTDPAIYQMIKTGKQKMDGRTALNYARFRHDDENDFGRVKRQQQVMTAITSKAKSVSTLLKTPDAIKSVLKVTSTNVNKGFLYRALFAILLGQGNKKIDKMSVPANDDKTYTSGLDMYGGEGMEINCELYCQKAIDFLEK